MKIIQAPKVLGYEDFDILDIKQDGEKFYVQYHKSVENGFPSPAEDFAGEKISLDERYLSKIESTYVVRAKGLSNSPAIFPGDILVIRADLQINDGDLGVFSFNNSKFTTKILDAKNNRLLPLNTKDFEVINVSEGDVVITMGKVDALVRENILSNFL